MRPWSAALMLTVACPLSAQVPDEVRAQLGRDGVARTEAFVFASATGLIRGSPEVEESRQATRAMQVLARIMCNFDPTLGKRLDADIKGFAMVSSVQRGREVEVIMRAPLQNPSCRVLGAAQTASSETPTLGAAQPAFNLDGSAGREPSVRILAPAYVREKNMTIRVYGNEY